jgi:hypothetical protein
LVRQTLDRATMWPMSTSPRRDDPRIGAWRAFLRAHAQVIRRLERELQDRAGHGAHDYDVLVQLARSDQRRLRMSELADRLCCRDPASRGSSTGWSPKASSNASCATTTVAANGRP